MYKPGFNQALGNQSSFIRAHCSAFDGEHIIASLQLQCNVLLNHSQVHCNGLLRCSQALLLVTHVLRTLRQLYALSFGGTLGTTLRLP